MSKAAARLAMASPIVPYPTSPSVHPPSSRWYGDYVAANRGQRYYGRLYKHSPTEKRDWLQYLKEALYHQPWPSIAEL